MALFIDGNISDIEDLLRYDSVIQRICESEGISLISKLVVSEQEISIAVEEFLQKRLGEAGSGMLSHVVVTPALKQWHTIHTLALIYSDALNSQVNQRHEAKYKEYKARARRAAAHFFQLGAGVVDVPIRKATVPSVRALSGPLPPATYIVHIAWSNAIGETGAASEAAAVSLEHGGGFGVSVAEAPEGAVGFSVYAGPVDTSPKKQNETLIELTTEWTVPLGGLTEGAPPSKGQEPDWFVKNQRVLQRG